MAQPFNVPLRTTNFLPSLAMGLACRFLRCTLSLVRGVALAHADFVSPPTAIYTRASITNLRNQTCKGGDDNQEGER